jgi:hypothetical protein
MAQMVAHLCSKYKALSSKSSTAKKKKKKKKTQKTKKPTFSVMVNVCCVSLLKKNPSHARHVVHTCNPSYSGGRDQEDHGLKPASPWQIVLKILFWKKLNTKKVWWSGSSGRAPAEALSSNSSTTKN